MGELLDAGHPVLGGVEARLQQPQRERRQLEHLAAPLDRLHLELLERDDGVDEAHLERLLRVVLAAEEPDLLRLLLADLGREQARAEAAVERADLRAGLAEARVVGGDREVADDVQHVAAADRVAGDHRDHRLRQPPDLDVQVGDVEAPDGCLGARLGHVARVAAHALVAAGAEGQRTLAGQHDHADRGVLARPLERVGDLDQRLRPERVAHLGAVDRDLRDPVRRLVADVLVVARRLPLGAGRDRALRLLGRPVAARPGLVRRGHRARKVRPLRRCGAGHRLGGRLHNGAVAVRPCGGDHRIGG